MAGAIEGDDLPLSPDTAKSRRPVSVPPSLLSVWAVPLLHSCHCFVGTPVAVLGQVLCAQYFLWESWEWSEGWENPSSEFFTSITVLIYSLAVLRICC